MKKIFVFWDSASAAHNLDNVVSKLAKTGEKTFKIVAAEHVRTYPNVCVPLAALMDWYKSKGYEFICSFPGTSNYVEYLETEMKVTKE